MTHIESILSLYDLPTVPDLYTNPPSKLLWKRMVNDVVSQAASHEIAEEALSKSTLRLLNPVFLPRTPHNALCHIENPLQVVRANTKICLLVDVYPLATVQRPMNQIDSDICSLCDLGEKYSSYTGGLFYHKKFVTTHVLDSLSISALTL